MVDPTAGFRFKLPAWCTRDLTAFNHRAAPKTAGLDEQKKLSLGTSESWWLDVLHRGYVYRSKIGLESSFGEWRAEVTTEVLFASYNDHAKVRNERHPMTREALGRFMVGMGAKYIQPRNAVVGEHLADVTNPYGGTTRKAELVKKARATGYDLGPLPLARDAFTNKTGLAMAWEVEDDAAN